MRITIIKYQIFEFIILYIWKCIINRKNSSFVFFSSSFFKKRDQNQTIRIGVGKIGLIVVIIYDASKRLSGIFFNN